MNRSQLHKQVNGVFDTYHKYLEHNLETPELEHDKRTTEQLRGRVIHSNNDDLKQAIVATFKDSDRDDMILFDGMIDFLNNLLDIYEAKKQ